MTPDPSTPPLPPDPPVPADEADEIRSAAAAAEFAAQLQAFETTRPAVTGAATKATRKSAPALRVGSRMSCRIVAVSGDSLLLDIGGRSEAVADAAEFRAEDGTFSVAVGETVELFVVEAGDQVVLAKGARRRAGGSLESVRQARKAELPVRGKVTGVNTGGLAVEVDGVKAFCPLSQIDTAHVEDPAPFVGRVLEFLVTEVDESRQRVVLSRRRLLQREQSAIAKERLEDAGAGAGARGHDHAPRAVRRVRGSRRLRGHGARVGVVARTRGASARRGRAGRQGEGEGAARRAGQRRPPARRAVAACRGPGSVDERGAAVHARRPRAGRRGAAGGVWRVHQPGPGCGRSRARLAGERQAHPARARGAVARAGGGSGRADGRARAEAHLAVVEECGRRDARGAAVARDPQRASAVRASARGPRETCPANRGQGSSAGRGQGSSAGRSRPGGRGSERSSESEAWRPPPPPVDDSPTLMQLAFRRAREAAERREAKPK